jgi:hypothetical protein
MPLIIFVRIDFIPDNQKRIFKSTADLGAADIRSLYDGLNSPIAGLDCGRKWAPHNPSGKPFCCDSCHEVPAVYESEWKYLQPNTDLWHKWRGDECDETVPEEFVRTYLRQALCSFSGRVRALRLSFRDYARGVHSTPETISAAALERRLLSRQCTQREARARRSGPSATVWGFTVRDETKRQRHKLRWKCVALW